MALRSPRNALPLLLSAAAACASAAGPEPFSRSAADFVRDEIHVGINIGNTLDVPSGNETDWGNVPVTRELIRAYREKGFDTVRIPVTWDRRFDHDAPGHPIEPAFLARVKEVAGWCLDEGLVTIVNTHHDGSWQLIDGEHEERAGELLRDLWTQIARELGGAGERLVFESFNEVRKARGYGGPDGRQKGQDDWTGRAEYFETVNRWAEIFVEAVRATGGNNAKRYLMVPTYAAGFQEATCAGWRSPRTATASSPTSTATSPATSASGATARSTIPRTPRSGSGFSSPCSRNTSPTAASRSSSAR